MADAAAVERAGDDLSRTRTLCAISCSSAALWSCRALRGVSMPLLPLLPLLSAAVDLTAVSLWSSRRPEVEVLEEEEEEELLGPSPSPWLRPRLRPTGRLGAMDGGIITGPRGK